MKIRTINEKKKSELSNLIYLYFMSTSGSSADWLYTNLLFNFNNKRKLKMTLNDT